jgi:osmotically-inducible protein OsmY
MAAAVSLQARDAVAVSDATLTLDCEAALRSFGSRVRVQVTHGWVNLSGSVTHACDRWRAEEQAGRVPGARGVSAQILVRAAY